jgi:hypothetical protein
MKEKNVVSLTSFDLPPHLITAINAFDDAMIKAIDDVIAARVHRGMIVGMLHAYAHYQTQIMCDDGYA